MKYLKVTILIAMVVAIASCKKAYVFTQADLIGTWTEKEPYVYSNGHFILQFNSNDTVVQHGFPDTCISAYVLSNNNNIQLNNCLPDGPGATGSTTFQITGDATDLTVLKFVALQNGPGGSLVYSNLNLKKN